MPTWEDMPERTSETVWEDIPERTPSKGQVYVKPIPGFSAETTAAIYTGVGAMSSSVRGIAQFMQEKFPALESVMPDAFKKETIDEQQRTVAALHEDPEYKVGAISGSIAGTLADPVMYALPLGKAVSLKQFIKQSTVAGGVLGGISAKTEEQSRGKHAAMGVVAGAAGGAILGKIIQVGGKQFGKDWLPWNATAKEREVIIAEITRGLPEETAAAEASKVNHFLNASEDEVNLASVSRGKEADRTAALLKEQQMEEGFASIASRSDLEQKTASTFKKEEERLASLETLEDSIRAPRPSKAPAGMKGEAGFVSPQLSANIAGAGAGALLNPEDPLTGAAIGLGLAHGGGRLLSKLPNFGGNPFKDLSEEGGKVLKSTFQHFDEFAGQIGTRINNINPVVGKAVLDVQRKIKQGSSEVIQSADNFFKQAGKKDVKESVKLSWLNQDRTTIRNSLSGEAKDSFTGIETFLDGVGKELSARGITRGVIEGYLPRMVKDREGILNTLNLEAKSELTSLLETAARGKGKLSELEEATIIDKYLRSGRHGFKPGYTKGRTIDEVTADMAKFYYAPDKAYHSYVQKATNDIHIHDFFGKSKVVEDGALDVEKSLGKWITEQGDIPPAKIEELKKLLDATFRSSYNIASPAIQLYKNVSTGLALGNIVSSAANLGDPIMSTFRYGLAPTLKAILQTVKGENKLSTKNYGLIDHISEEFANQAPSQRYVTRVMNLAGWGILDSFGKNTHFNSSLLRAQSWSKSEEGMVKLQERYGEVFGKDFPQLQKDLQGGEASDLVRSMSFWDVAQHQPLTVLQKSAFQLRNPNISAFTHQFKSFMMSQANLVRVDAYNEIKKGNVQKGLSSLAKLGMGFVAVGVINSEIRDFLLGRTSAVSTSDIANNAFKQVGYNDYAAKKFSEGKVKEGIISYIAPSAQIADVAVAGTRDLFGIGGVKQQEEDRSTMAKAIPVVGKVYESRFMGGAKKYEKKALKKTASETPAALRQKEINDLRRELKAKAERSGY